MGCNTSKSLAWHKSMTVSWDGDLMLYKTTKLYTQSLEVFFDECLKFLKCQHVRHDSEVTFMFDVEVPTTIWANYSFTYSNVNKSTKFYDMLCGKLVHFIVIHNIREDSIFIIRSIRVNKCA